MLLLRNLHGRMPGPGSHGPLQSEKDHSDGHPGNEKGGPFEPVYLALFLLLHLFERCPQDVKIPELMNAIKNIAVREGYLPPAMKIQLDLLSIFWPSPGNHGV